jgi:hypothetical protein
MSYTANTTILDWNGEECQPDPRSEVPKLWGALPGVRKFVCMRDINFKRNISARKKYKFLMHFAWFKYLSVIVLASNYKQHILSPAKVGKL